MREGTDTERSSARKVDFGVLLRRWRGARGLSQLALAGDAGISGRHVSFIETGRSQPSRDLVLRLAEVLDLPIRGRNELLQAAGYAAMFRETPLDQLPGDGVPAVLRHILAQQEPYPAVVADRGWNVLTCNAATIRFSRAFIDPESHRQSGSAGRNLMKQLFDPLLLRPFVEDWPAIAQQILLRLRHEAAEGAVGAPSAQLLADLQRYPDVPPLHGGPGLPPNTPAMTVSLRRGDLALRYISMLSTFGTPQDVTLQELRIKLFYPADAASAEAFRRLATA